LQKLLNIKCCQKIRRIRSGGILKRNRISSSS
jgi:hypothetical protein